VDLVVLKEDELLLDLMLNDGTNKIYNISYDNGLITRTFNGYIVSLIEDGTFNDTLKLKVAFGVANE
jgi:hypothetical protein